MNDPVDRQSVINILLYFNAPQQLEMIKKLPSIQPERKKGKWKHGCCSECEYNWGKDAPIANVPNFCPNCGADMREEAEDGNC